MRIRPVLVYGTKESALIQIHLRSTLERVRLILNEPRSKYAYNTVLWCHGLRRRAWKSSVRSNYVVSLPFQWPWGHKRHCPIITVRMAGPGHPRPNGRSGRVQPQRGSGTGGSPKAAPRNRRQHPAPRPPPRPHWPRRCSNRDGQEPAAASGQRAARPSVCSRRGLSAPR